VCIITIILLLWRKTVIGQVAVNDESGCDRSIESHSGGGGLELQALVARLLSMLSKKNSSSSPSSKSRGRTAMESGGSCTSSTAGRTGFLQASIKPRLWRTRLRRRKSFLAAGCVQKKVGKKIRKNREPKSLNRYINYMLYIIYMRVKRLLDFRQEK